MRVGPILDAARRRAYRQAVNAQALRAERALQRHKTEWISKSEPVFRINKQVQDAALERNEAMAALLHPVAGFQPVRAKRQSGGGMYLPPAVGNVGFDEREDYRQELMRPQVGFLNSSVPGRTDHLALQVPAGSFVLPSDVLSGVAEGNSIAGARLFQQALGVGPGGVPIPQARGRGSPFQSMPHPPAPYRESDTPASRGGAHHNGVTHGTVPISAAGGEMIIPPDVIRRHPLLGNLPAWDRNPRHEQEALDRGHHVLRKLVLRIRKKSIAETKRLPAPAR
jgi:hypothetical protein